ncbi:hypothetical protein WN943_005842 [Citrus x changshan-huyou]
MEHPFVKRPLQTSSPQNKQVPLDVLKQLLAVDNWTNLERFALDLATLLFILRWRVLGEYALDTTAYGAKSEKLRWCTHSIIAYGPPADRSVAFKLLGFLPFMWARFFLLRFSFLGRVLGINLV